MITHNLSRILSLGENNENERKKTGETTRASKRNTNERTHAFVVRTRISNSIGSIFLNRNMKAKQQCYVSKQSFDRQ